MNTEQEKSKPPSPENLNLLDMAIRGFQHAENVIQARLSNFLFADSILFLSWAAVYAGSAQPPKKIVLVLLALLSALLGFLWTIAGCRHRKFLFVHTGIIAGVEALLPEQCRVHERITSLQIGKSVTAGDKSYKLNGLEAKACSRMIGILAPGLMTIISLLLIIVSLRT
jgi:hypothetical protein